MLDSRFLLTLFYVCKTNFSSVNGNIQRNFDELAVSQYKFLDDTADAQTDFCELDKKLHGGRLDGMVGLQMICGQVIINVLTGHVVFVQKHEGSLFKKLPAAAYFL